MSFLTIIAMSVKSRNLTFPITLIILRTIILQRNVGKLQIILSSMNISINDENDDLLTILHTKATHEFI
jgi:hypothetical protein